VRILVPPEIRTPGSIADSLPGASNETVEKPNSEAIAYEPSNAFCGPSPTLWYPTSAPGLCGSCRSPAPHVPPLCQASVALALLDGMPQAVLLPLRTHCARAPACESMEALGVAAVTTHRRDDPEATTLCITTDDAVDLALHLVAGLLRLARASTYDKGPLAHGSALRRAQTWRAADHDPPAPRVPRYGSVCRPATSPWPPLLYIR
jgi:hypothetical protein